MCPVRFGYDGLTELHGFDGDWVRPEQYICAPGTFTPHDLTQPVRLGRRFDLAVSLEVAEHLPEDCADRFVDSLVGLSDKILFSAAINGQTGANHINEQPHQYWIDKFAARGYSCKLELRDMLRDNAHVCWWYRQNIMVLVRNPIGPTSSEA